MKPVKVTAAYVASVQSGYVAFIEEFPTIYGQGATFDEARTQLLDGLELWLTSNRHITKGTFEGRPVVKRETVAVVGPVESKRRK
jgi:predicted RNase H-like HicB family nuclease